MSTGDNNSIQYIEYWNFSCDCYCGSECQALFLSSIDQLQQFNIEGGILKATNQKHIHVDAWWDFQMKVSDNFLKTTALP